MASYRPHINFMISAEKDINSFNFFLNHHEHRGKRSKILVFYPELDKKIQKEKIEKIVVNNTILNMYERYNNEIQDIINIANNEFAKSELAFKALAKYMEYPQLNCRSYTAIPTFLPFSPININDKIFYFSIASAIANKSIQPFKILTIIIHEISHFIFAEQLDIWIKTHKLKLNMPTIHYFKEALTATIMNQSEFKNFFNYPVLFNSNNYPGNPELHQLLIHSSQKTQNIIHLFEKEILQNYDDYNINVIRLLQKFEKNNNAFTEKWNLWNDKHNNLNAQKKFINQYSNPIKL